MLLANFYTNKTKAAAPAHKANRLLLINFFRTSPGSWPPWYRRLFFLLQKAAILLHNLTQLLQTLICKIQSPHFSATTTKLPKKCLVPFDSPLGRHKSSVPHASDTAMSNTEIHHDQAPEDPGTVRLLCWTLVLVSLLNWPLVSAPLLDSDSGRTTWPVLPLPTFHTTHSAPHTLPHSHPSNLHPSSTHEPSMPPCKHTTISSFVKSSSLLMKRVRRRAGLFGI
jgi:hypothetical protein